MTIKEAWEKLADLYEKSIYDHDDWWVDGIELGRGICLALIDLPLDNSVYDFMRDRIVADVEKQDPNDRITIVRKEDEDLLKACITKILKTELEAHQRIAG